MATRRMALKTGAAAAAAIAAGAVAGAGSEAVASTVTASGAPTGSGATFGGASVHPYIGSGPYCYANSLAMMLGPAAPPPSLIEVLTASPFGFQLLAGRVPHFTPYGWYTERGLDDAVAALGWACRTEAAPDDASALATLRNAVRRGPVLAGPLEIGLLRHQPEMSGPIGADHFVQVLEVTDDVVRFHDPQGHPYASLPPSTFLAAWRADTIAYPHQPYTLRTDFRRVRWVTPDAALRKLLPTALAWLRGIDAPVPPGTLGGAAAANAFADQVAIGLAPDVRNHLLYFAVRLGARRLTDAAVAMASIGRHQAATILTRQAKLVGSLQYDLVVGENEAAANTLRTLAPTYEELASALGR
jgi:hypothetical protein